MSSSMSLVFEKGAAVMELTDLARLTGQPAPRIPAFAFPALGLQESASTLLCILCWCWVLNLGLHACMVSTLTVSYLLKRRIHRKAHLRCK